LDIFGGLIGTLLSFPIILVAIIFIKIESSGPAIFMQRRVGYKGKIFTIFKLRGMYIDSKYKFPELYDYSNKKSLNFYFHDKNDPRVTKVGKYIRKTSIDELPNFINVLLGSMSLVGPRPEIKEVLMLYGKDKEKYLSVKPGITCNSKADLRDTLTKEETLKLDLDYIDQMNFILDLKLLFRTAKNVFSRKNVIT
tara:strand:+ start:126 stop:710 length:585 start_codon:yes stop_codon:yes gene_type:complete